MTVSAAVEMRHIRAFLAVADARSFTRAADEIGLSQPALTACIRQLEENLGVPVFARTTRRVSLTTAGEDFRPVAQRLLRDFDGALATLKAHAGAQRGTVSIAALPSIAAEWLPPVIASFAREYPAIGINLVSESSPGIVQLLRAGEVNLGFVGMSFEEPDLLSSELTAEPIQLVCRPDHVLASAPRPVRWIDLLGHDFLDPHNNDCMRMVLKEVPELAQTLAGARHRTNKVAVLVALLLEGMGVTALPRLAVPRKHRAQLVFCPLSDPIIYRRIFLLRRREHSPAPAEQRFLDQLFLRMPAIISDSGHL